MPKSTALLVAVPLLVLAACGMKGDLYETAPPAAAPEPAATEPAAPAEDDGKGERKITPRAPDPAVAQ